MIFRVLFYAHQLQTQVVILTIVHLYECSSIITSGARDMVSRKCIRLYLNFRDALNYTTLLKYFPELFGYGRGDNGIRPGIVVPDGIYVKYCTGISGIQ